MTALASAAAAGAPLWPDILLPAGAGLLGALIGGAASLLATRSANRHALRMLRLQRREEAADDALGALWAVISTNAPDTMTADEVVDPMSVAARVFDLANRCAGDEPHLVRLCHDHGWMAERFAPWPIYRNLCAALSAALTHWRRNPKEFAQQRLALGDYLDQLKPEMDIRDELKRQQRDME